MRWPDWLPWRRPARPAAPPAASAPSGPPAWDCVPPVQRTVAPMPVVAPVSRLTAALSSWEDPRLLTSLGHVVAADAPGGRVEGLVRPAPGPVTRPGGPELPLAHAPEVPRRTARATVQRSRSAVEPPPPPSGAPHAGAGGDVPPESPETVPASREEPSWTLPPAPPAPGPRRLTDAAPVGHEPVARPVVPVQRTTAPAGPPDAASPSAAEERPGGPPGGDAPADVVPPALEDPATALAPEDPAIGPGGGADTSSPGPVPSAGGELPGGPPAEPGIPAGGAPPVEIAPLAGGVPAHRSSYGEPAGTDTAPPLPGLPVTPLAVQRAVPGHAAAVEPPAGGTPAAGRARRSRIGAPLPAPVDLQRTGTARPPATGPADRSGPALPAAAAGEVRGLVGALDDGSGPAPLPTPQTPATPPSPGPAPEPGRAAPDEAPPVAVPSITLPPAVGEEAAHAVTGDEAAGVAPAADVPPPAEEVVRGLVGAPDDGPSPEALPVLQRAADGGGALRGMAGLPVEPRAVEERSVQWLAPEDPLPVAPARTRGAGDGGDRGMVLQRTADPALPAAPAVPGPPAPAVPGPPAPAFPGPSAPATGTAVGAGAETAAHDGVPPVVRRAADPADRPAAVPSPPTGVDDATTDPPPDPGEAGSADPVRTVPLLGERPMTGALFPASQGAVQRAATASAGRTPEPVVGAPPRPGSAGVAAGGTWSGTTGSASQSPAAGRAEVVVARWATPDPVVGRRPVGVDPPVPGGSIHPAGPAAGSSGPRGPGSRAVAAAADLPVEGATGGAEDSRPGGAAVGPAGAPALQLLRGPGPAPARSSPPGREPGAPAPVQRFSDPGSAAVAAGIAVRDADGSVVFRPPPAAPGIPGPTAASPTWPPVPVARRETAVGAGAAIREVPVVQREEPGVVAAEEPVPGTGGADATPAPSPAAGPASGSPPVPAGPPFFDLDELARRLFDPLSARLRAELRLDRERAGVVTDLRH